VTGPVGGAVATLSRIRRNRIASVSPVSGSSVLGTFADIVYDIMLVSFNASGVPY
jgi:hypothetical protein